MRTCELILGGYLLSACGGQVVAIKLPQYDPNPSAHDTCVPEGESGFACRSRQTFNQYDRELGVSSQQCAYGVSRVYVETDWRGNVTRLQYTCSTAAAGDFPTGSAAAAGSSAER